MVTLAGIIAFCMLIGLLFGDNKDSFSTLKALWWSKNGVGVILAIFGFISGLWALIIPFLPYIIVGVIVFWIIGDESGNKK